MEAWADTLVMESNDVIDADATFQQQSLLPALAAAQQRTGDANYVLNDQEREVCRQAFREARRGTHMQTFPFNDNLLALIMTAQADLSEQQRERLAAIMTQRGIAVNRYTVELIRNAVIELFCVPRNSLENPNLRAGMKGLFAF